MAKLARLTVAEHLKKEYFKSAIYRQVFEHRTEKNADGTPVRCSVNGKCKLWKTRPAHFKLPVKYGFYACFYITHENCDEWIS